jgi:hypothetical protein
VSLTPTTGKLMHQTVREPLGLGPWADSKSSQSGRSRDGLRAEGLGSGLVLVSQAPAPNISVKPSQCFFVPLPWDHQTLLRLLFLPTRPHLLHLTSRSQVTLPDSNHICWVK